MIRRFAPLALIVLLLATQPCALAVEAANYEISSYVLHMAVQEDGDVRVREEIIYNNPGSYDGLDLPVSLEGTGGLSDVAVWRDGEALDELPSGDALPGEGEGFAVKEEDGRALIEIVSAGDSDSHAFACAYTLSGLARRYNDTALIDRTLIPTGREVMLQNAVVIVTLPRSDGDVLAYADGAAEEIPLLVQYDTVNIGPIDVAADEALSLQLLFPAEWLEGAEVIPTNMRASVVAPRQRAEENTARENNARRAEQYTATAIYAVVFIGALVILIRKYGIKGRIKGGPDESLLEKYPAALAVYAVRDKAGEAALTGTLAELAAKGAVSIREDENGTPLLRLEHSPDELAEHEKAALDIVFSGKEGEWVTPASLYSAGNYEQAQDLCRRFAAYNKAVAADAHRAGLTWQNDAILIVAALLNILCGVILGFVLLLVGKRMLLEACGVAVFMFAMVSQINRVRQLTDEGERLQKAAQALSDRTEAAQRHFPLAAALGLIKETDSNEGAVFARLLSRLREVYYGAATLRRSRKKKK